MNLRLHRDLFLNNHEKKDHVNEKSSYNEIYYANFYRKFLFQIDESLFGRKRKYNPGNNFDGVNGELSIISYQLHGMTARTDDVNICIGSLYVSVSSENRPYINYRRLVQFAKRHVMKRQERNAVFMHNCSIAKNELMIVSFVC